MSDAPEVEKPATDTPVIDPAQATYLRQRLESEQNLALGIAGGLAAALVGAGVWAAVTVATGYQLGVMAIAIGFLVGYAIRTTGKGITNVFGVAGASLALVGGALGNLLAVTAFVAGHEEVPVLDALSRLSPQLAQELMVAFFSPMDLLFYGIAAYEGYRLSFRQLGDEELQRMLSGSAVT